MWTYIIPVFQYICVTQKCEIGDHAERKGRCQMHTTFQSERRNGGSHLGDQGRKLLTLTCLSSSTSPRILLRSVVQLLTYDTCVIYATFQLLYLLRPHSPLLTTCKKGDQEKTDKNLHFKIEFTDENLYFLLNS